MTRRTVRRSALVLCVLGLCAPIAHADDRPFDRDWATGVAVAPGAQTWTDDHFDNKKDLIKRSAAARGKTCNGNYAALAWAPASGKIGTIMADTRNTYAAAGFSVEEAPGDIDTEHVWTVANPQAGREAMILWGDFQGSTIYLSCLTGGTAATDPDKPLYLGALSILGLALLGSGAWLIWRARKLGAASLSWPTATGTIKSSEVKTYDADGIEKYIAKVAYDYTIAGKAFTGDCLRFGAYAGSRQRAQQDVDKYRPGMRVDVRYAPEEPQTSTLEPGTAGISPAGLALAAGGAAILVLTGVVAIFA